MAVNFLSLSLASLKLHSHKELFQACSQLTEAPWVPILSSVLLISGHGQLGHGSHLTQAGPVSISFSNNWEEDSKGSLMFFSRELVKRERASLSHSREPGDQHAGEERADAQEEAESIPSESGRPAF